MACLVVVSGDAALSQAPPSSLGAAGTHPVDGSAWVIEAQPSESIRLACDEIATFRQGTDTRTAVAEVARLPLLNERRVTLDIEEPMRRDFEIAVPNDSPHSFVSPNNEIRWSIEVLIEQVNRGDLKRRFPLIVYPRQVASPGSERPLVEAVPS